uniref:Uncharacterized protein n=1 Tax=Talaromyces marneffei PM1 TaxID=1077442 RepID=A0A093UVE1_TALMA
MSLRRTAALSPALTSKNSLLVPLIDSPLPSPVLPSIVPSHGKRLPGAGKRKAFRIFRLLAVCAIILTLVRMPLLQLLGVPTLVQWLADDRNYQLPSILPVSASPVIMTNKQGRQKWTVHIPAGMEFPYAPSQIEDLSSQCFQMSQQVSDGRHQPFDYSQSDPNFIDITDRQSARQMTGLLSNEQIVIQKRSNLYCDSSLTFVMQSEDAGLGTTLMNLWISYGLAQKQGRNFFIDDTNWAYGKFSKYFKSPPKPMCRQPPPAFRLPCPLQARHLVVSSSNAPWIFGDTFKEYFKSPFAASEAQQKVIFEMARSGYEALFHLIGDDATYFQSSIQRLNRDVRSKGGIAIGIHVRHGDSHPLEPQYKASHIPLDRYAKRVSTIFHAHLQQAHGDTALSQSMALHSKVMLASDDPEVYTSFELGGAERAQNYIALASKSALDAARNEGLSNENIGWEGGFFQDMFWSLGVEASDYSELGGPFPSNRGPTEPKTLSVDSVAEQRHLRPSKESLQLREWIARAYLLDVAVLGQSDRVICGLSSASCRLLAVMMGWNKAVTHKSWQNIDGNWHWSFIVP